MNNSVDQQDDFSRLEQALRSTHWPQWLIDAFLEGGRTTNLLAETEESVVAGYNVFSGLAGQSKDNGQGVSVTIFDTPTTLEHPSVQGLIDFSWHHASYADGVPGFADIGYEYEITQKFLENEVLNAIMHHSTPLENSISTTMAAECFLWLYTLLELSKRGIAPFRLGIAELPNCKLFAAAFAHEGLHCVMALNMDKLRVLNAAVAGKPTATRH